MDVLAYRTADDFNVVEKNFVFMKKFTGTLRDPCSLLRPVIVFEYNTIPSKWTHLYIPEFNDRWYLITDIVSAGKNLVQISARVDVLQTYKGNRGDQTGLYGLTAYVSRNQYQHNYRLSDTHYPFLINPTVSYVTSQLGQSSTYYGTTSYLDGTGTYRYLIIMQGEGKNSGLSVDSPLPLLALVTNSSGFARFCSDVSETSISISGKKLTDYIYSMGALPCEIPHGSQVTQIEMPGILSQTMDLHGYYYVPSNSAVVLTSYFSTTINKPSNKFFENNAPFTKYSVTFQPFGKFELDSKYFVTNNLSPTCLLSFKVKIDLLTGSANLYYGGTNPDVYLGAANVLYKMPLSSSSFSGMSMASSAVNIIGSLASTIATEGASAPAFFGSIISGVQSLATPNSSITGGDTKLIDARPRVEIMHFDTVTPNESFFGEMFCNTVSLHTVYGYTEITRIRLDNIIATAEEKSELTQILANGVVFESP